MDLGRRKALPFVPLHCHGPLNSTQWLSKTRRWPRAVTAAAIAAGGQEQAAGAAVGDWQSRGWEVPARRGPHVGSKHPYGWLVGWLACRQATAGLSAGTAYQGQLDMRVVALGKGQGGCKRSACAYLFTPLSGAGPELGWVRGPAGSCPRRCAARQVHAPHQVTAGTDQPGGPTRWRSRTPSDGARAGGRADKTKPCMNQGSRVGQEDMRAAHQGVLHQGVCRFPLAGRRGEGMTLVRVGGRDGVPSVQAQAGAVLAGARLRLRCAPGFGGAGRESFKRAVRPPPLLSVCWCVQLARGAAGLGMGGWLVGWAATPEGVAAGVWLGRDRVAGRAGRARSCHVLRSPSQLGPRVSSGRRQLGQPQVGSHARSRYGPSLRRLQREVQGSDGGAMWGRGRRPFASGFGGLSIISRPAAASAEWRWFIRLPVALFVARAAACPFKAGGCCGDTCMDGRMPAFHRRDTGRHRRRVIHACARCVGSDLGSIVIFPGGERKVDPSAIKTCWMVCRVPVLRSRKVAA
ncbi:hypothetical protein PLESTB_001397600 [Pleodorina starrii]|uniref:Uncharacterized protein n=1 Tax=Pleodorina starrii TaxID=330485 RepID=A0A9W6BV05_9CHLO|nr:hypothetical protein PLESTM_000534700 [Pleodorina starrii]GLC58757.1 hypothetical protein PLESTB_001397600 [Pleodorina starrii]GLC75158.1 hypothetical protein PLESTF_001601500 [Pleodorina starrii]